MPSAYWIFLKWSTPCRQVILSHNKQNIGEPEEKCLGSLCSSFSKIPAVRTSYMKVFLLARRHSKCSYHAGGSGAKIEKWEVLQTHYDPIKRIRPFSPLLGEEDAECKQWASSYVWRRKKKVRNHKRRKNKPESDLNKQN